MGNKNYKRCPRCGARTVSNASACAKCNLIFDRVKNLSNEEAKKAIKNKEKEKVLYISERPDDVDKKKFLLLYIFLGWFGAYNIYIGKYKKGYYSLITFSLFLFLFILEEILLFSGVNTESLNYFIVMPSCTFAVLGILIWFIDLLSFCTKSFKYPAAMKSGDYLKTLSKSKKFRNVN